MRVSQRERVIVVKSFPVIRGSYHSVSRKFHPCWELDINFSFDFPTCFLKFPIFAAYKLPCYHRRNFFVCVSRIARPSGRNWVGLYEGRSIPRPLLFSIHVIFFHSLPARVGYSFQGKLFSIFKLLRFVFVRYYFSSRTALENCVLFVIALRSSWENFFADTRFVLLTRAINLYIQAQLVFSVDCTGELIIRFRKH